MRQAVTLLLVGLAVAALTWAGLRVVEGLAAHETTRRVRICKSPDPVAGSSEGGRAWWEEQRFAQYARSKGWDDVELDVKIVVGDYLQKDFLLRTGKAGSAVTVPRVVGERCIQGQNLAALPSSTPGIVSLIRASRYVQGALAW